MDIAKTCLEILNRLGPIDEKVKRVKLELECELGKNASRQYMTAVMNRKVREDGSQFEVESNPVLAEIWKETERQLIESDQRRAANRAGGQVKLQEGLKANDENQDAKSDVLDLFYQPPTPISLEERETHPEKKYYVSDAIDMTELEGGKLNLIYSPPGTGKTTFIKGELKRYSENFPHRLLYLAPQVSLVEQFKREGRLRKGYLPNGRYYLDRELDGIAAMTYAAFGSRINSAKQSGLYSSEEWWEHDSVICLDELSQAVHQSFYPGEDENSTALALKELLKRVEDESNVVVTLSATPKAALDYFVFWNSAPFKVIKSTFGLKGYRNQKEIEFSDIDNLLDSISPQAKGLIYTKQIKQVNEIVEQLRSRGIRAMGIWSLHAKDFPMDKEQREVRDHLIKTESYPDDLQVLVINAAYETGININPSKTKLEYVIVNNSNQEVITQARGRYRGDIETLYKRASGGDGVERYIDPDIVEPYLGIKLYRKAKDKLRQELGFKDDHGRLMGWKKTSNQLQREYLVIDGKKDSIGRYSLIQKRKQASG